jgi:hypothetical protein
LVRIAIITGKEDDATDRRVAQQFAFLGGKFKPFKIKYDGTQGHGAGTSSGLEMTIGVSA